MRIKFTQHVLVSLFLLCLWPVHVVALNKILPMRASVNKQQARLVIPMSQQPQYKWFILDKPPRLVIDFDKADLFGKAAKLPLPNAALNAVRTGKSSATGVRLVLDLTRKVTPNIYLLKPHSKNPYRLVVDLPLTKPDNTIARSVAAKKSAAKHVPMTQQSVRDLVVVIDPGHGGKDPGARGRRGTQEKHVVLAISKRLASLINQTPGMKAKLTRSGDYYVTLRGRLRKARQEKADIFIAIHADAYRNARSRGASVFALSERGASSEAARWLADRENQSELGGIQLHDKGRMLKSVLLDLAQTATISASVEMGKAVLGQLKKIGNLHSNNVEQARFVVLKSPDIPSILVETGFISNPTEEQRLRSPAYQKKIAQAILNGIRQYVARKPPRGTWFAARK